MHYIIKPMTGWEENFKDEQQALKRATEIINNDEERMRTLHNYKEPKELVQEVWDSLDEMHQALSD